MPVSTPVSVGKYKSALFFAAQTSDEGPPQVCPKTNPLDQDVEVWEQVCFAACPGQWVCTHAPGQSKIRGWGNIGGVPCAVRALCEKLAVLHHREFGKFRRLKGRH